MKKVLLIGGLLALMYSCNRECECVTYEDYKVTESDVYSGFTKSECESMGLDLGDGWKIDCHKY